MINRLPKSAARTLGLGWHPASAAHERANLATGDATLKVSESRSCWISCTAVSRSALALGQEEVLQRRCSEEVAEVADEEGDQGLQGPHSNAHGGEEGRLRTAAGHVADIRDDSRQDSLPPRLGRPLPSLPLPRPDSRRRMSVGYCVHDDIGYRVHETETEAALEEPGASSGISCNGSRTGAAL